VTLLGLQLAFAGGRRAVVAAVVTITAVAVGTTLFLLALCVPAALQARADRTAWMNGPFDYAAAAGDEGAAPHTIMSVGTDGYHALAIDVVTLAATGPRAPVPPGLVEVPTVGEVWVSPALEELMPSAPELQARYGRHVAGIIGDEALAGPDQLLAVRGVTRSDASWSGFPVQEFSRDGEVLQFTGIVRLLVLLGAVAMLVPVALLVAMTTRLSAASRDRRFAALRLAGATTSQICRLAAVESSVIGVAGAVSGTGLFFLTRPLAAYVSYDEGRWFLSDLAPGLSSLLLVGIAIPLVTVAASQLTLAKVARSPLGVSRQALPRPVTVWRLVPLAASIPLLGYVLTSDAATQAAGGRGRLVLGAFLLLLLTLVLAGAWFARAIGLALARSRRAASLLAGRRLADDPRAGFRSIAGVILAILVTTMFIATTPAAAESLRSTTTIGQQVGSAQASIINSPPRLSAELLGDVREIPGVSNAALVYEAQAADGNNPVKVWVGDCEEIVESARMQSVACGSAPVVVAKNRQSAVTAADGSIELYSFFSSGPTPIGSVPQATSVAAVSVSLSETAMMPAQTGVDMPGLLVSPNALSVSVLELRPTLMVVKYEDQAALERLRTVVMLQVPSSQVTTRETAYDGLSSDVRRLYRVLAIATFGVFLVAGCGLVVAVAIGLLERRRPFAMLRAAGTPLSTLRWTIFLEAAAPLSVMSVLAAVLGGLVGGWAASSSGSSQPLPWLALGLPILFGVVVALLVVASALPMVRLATGTGETRSD